MEEIVKVVVEKTGMPADQVRPVVQIVINELKQRLPEPIAGQVDTLLSNPAAGSVIGQAGDLLGGLFAKKD
jgi:hypothetical protein